MPDTMPPLTTLLVAAIERDGRTQIEIARAAGLSQSTMSYAVRGRDVRPETLVRLARALGIGPHRLGAMLYDAFPPEKKS